MKIKSERIIRIFLASAVLFSLTACEKDKASGDTFTDTRFVSMSTSSFSAGGEYMVSADDNRLHYWDINSSTETVICADPSCTHDTYNETDNPYPECTAVTSDGSVFGNTFIYSDRLYYFSNSGLNSTTLYVCDKNGKNKRKLHEFECDMAALTAPVTGEGKLFFLMQTAIIDVSETSGIAPEEYNYTIFSFEFDSQKLSVFKEYEKPKQFSLRSLYVYENCLYYEVFTSDASYSDIYDFETGQYKDDPIKHDSRKIVRLNLSDNSEEILFDSPTTRLIGGDGDKMYISQKETEDYSLPDSRIIEYSLSDGSVRDVLVQDGDYYSAGIFNGHDGNGGFECLNARSTMTKSGDEYTITNAAQAQYHFNANGELDWVKDANGNILTISSKSDNQRIVTDSTGRTYTVKYTDINGKSRIESIEDTTADRIVTYAYNNDAQLVSATSVSGGTEYYEYDGNGRLCKITNCYSEVTDEINYNDNGSVNWLTNAAGLKQVYTYDKAFNQTGLKEYDSDTLVKTFTYEYDEKYAIKTNTVETDGQTYEVDKITYNLTDGKNKYDEMSESKDIMDNTTEYQRDDNGNVIKTINPDGSYTLASYNDKNMPLVQVDESKNVVIYEYDESGVNVLKQYQSLTPVSNADALVNDLSLVIYADYAMTQYTYYPASETSGIIGLIHTITDPEGNVVEYTYGTTGNAKGLPIKKVIKDGDTVVNTVEYEYNSQLQVSKEKTSVDIANNVYAIREYEYDKFNNVTKISDFGTGSTAAVTITEYDKLSRKTAEYSPNYSADKSHGTTYTYYPSGSVKTQTDALGNVTSFEYNAYGNTIQQTNPDGTISMVEYDGLQREKAAYFKSSADGTQQILTSTAYEFETYTAPKIANAKSCSGLRTIKTAYISSEKQVISETMTDFRGNTIEEKTNDEIKRTCTYYANGQLASQTDALGNTATYEYNFLNKLTKTSTPFNSVNYSITENQYDKNGNVILTRQTVQEENSSKAKYSITQNEYNALGLLTQVTLSGTGSSEKNISKYFYNNAGIQTKMYTGLSSEDDTTYLTTEYTYDSWMRAVSTSDSTGYNSGTVTYDLNGNVLTSTDANGNITTNTYDALNRVLTSDTVNPDDSSKNVSKSYTYDNMGRITKTTSNDVTTTYAYDAMGRKYTESEYTADGNYSVFRGYFYEGVSKYMKEEITGLYHTLMYSNKTYEYDDEMRIIKVMESGNETVSYTYDANGNKKTETLANGVVSTYTYNNANRITKIENKSGNTDISTYEYSYYLDGSDACKVRTENGIIESTSYEYDGLKRLTEESVAVGSNTTDTYSYEYDDYGNRSKMTASGTDNYTTVYSYSDSNGNYTALLQKETKTVEAEENPLDLTSNVKYTVYTYDANGNQITKTADGKTETNTYNGLNQLIGFTDGETTASYAYNVSGLRYEKTVNGQTINHVWDGSQQIVADIVDNEFYEANCYIRGTNLVAKYSFFNGAKSEYTYYTQNAHGDVVNLTDADGNVIKTYTYDAFGVEKNIDDSDTNAFRYCGEYYDYETGTIYLRARYYNPSIGRFISRDSNPGKPGEPLSLNLYTYCHNNPIGYVDSNGHERIVVSGGRSEDESLYNFIETAILQIKDWQNPIKYGIRKSNDITWIVANWNYSDEDLKNFESTANMYGVNFMTINDKQELLDYINYSNDGARCLDPIESMTFFAHGTAFDQEYENPGHENDYSIALGYSHVSQNNKLNVFSSDLNKICSSSFAKSSYTYFASCRTGNKFNDKMSFAQSWANLTGGRVKAAVGTKTTNGKTYYGDIYEESFYYKVKGKLGMDTPRSTARKAYGYSPSGCYYYPTITDGGSFKIFKPNDEE